MRTARALLVLVAIALGTSTTFAGRGPVPWQTTYERDQNIGAPYWQCQHEDFGPAGMSENDEWYRVGEGTLSGTWEVTNPRPVCMEMPVRVAWRYLGNGKPPTFSLSITDPSGGSAPYRFESSQVVATKGGLPTWVRLCVNVSAPEGLGTYTFRVTGNGHVRVAASAAAAEFYAHECPNWPTPLNNAGI